MSALHADLIEAATDYQKWWDALCRYDQKGDPKFALAVHYLKLCEVRLLAVARGEPLMQLARKAPDVR